MSEDTYNGWTNWDTWNANLWLNNDPSDYRDACRATDANELRQVFEETFGEGYDDINMDKVNWQEIYEGLHEGEDKD